jgi:hypothetical protein
MSYSLPPIVKLAERLLVEVEQAVRSFPRYHKYQHGGVLREQARSVAQLCNRAWRDREYKLRWLEALTFEIDDLKLSLQVGCHIQAFTSLNQFEALARLASDLGRQCGGWRKQEHQRSQNGEKPRASSQRAQILSSQAASSEASP